MEGRGGLGHAVLLVLACLAVCAALPASAIAAPGDLDSTFDGDGKFTAGYGSPNEDVRAVAVQPDGKIVLAGVGDANQEFLLLRLNPNGSADTSFGTGGAVGIDFIPGGQFDRAQAIVIQPNGKIVVAGIAQDSSDQEFAVARLNANGSLDTSFDGDGKKTFGYAGSDGAFAVAVQPDGRIVLAGGGGAGSEFVVARLNTNGTPDTSFDGDGSLGIDFGGTDAIYAMARQPDGKFVLVGWTTAVGGHDIAVARINPDGSLDSSFDGDGKLTAGYGATEFGRAVVLQPDGKIVVASNGGINEDFILTRFNPNGTPDPSFDGDGSLGIDFGGDDDAGALALQPNGKIVVAGTAAGPPNPFSTNDFLVVRRNADGSPDATFNGGSRFVDFGSTDFGYAVALQPDGAIVAAGSANIPGPVNDLAAIRLLGDPPPATVNYARPGSATPMRIPLAPAYAPCTSSNSTHVGPLTYASCTPPALASTRVTTSNTGTQGAFARLTALIGNPATPADEADIDLNFYANDVRCASIPGCTAGNDYNGSLLVRLGLRLTDRSNGLGSQSATTADASFDVPVSCHPLPGPTGSTCSFHSTLDTLVPGTVAEGKRTIFDLLSLQALDTGADGTLGAADCSPTCGTGDEKAYLEPAVFLP